MVSQTGNPQGEVPLLPRPASGVVTTYCFCVWSWSSIASLRLRVRTACEIATVWGCAGLPAASTTAELTAAAVVGRHIAAAVMPLPSSPDAENAAANPAPNTSVLVAFPTAAHHLPARATPSRACHLQQVQWAGYGQRWDAGNVFIGHLFALVRGAESSRPSSTSLLSSTRCTARAPRPRKR